MSDIPSRWAFCKPFTGLLTRPFRVPQSDDADESSHHVGSQSVRAIGSNRDASDARLAERLQASLRQEVADVQLWNRQARSFGSARAALEWIPGQEYSEHVFLYFVDVERARAHRDTRSLRLLLATFEPVGQPIQMESTHSRLLFRGLKQSLRDTDVVGWYRQDLVAGVVLTQRADAPEHDVSQGVLRRVVPLLDQHLPLPLSTTLRLRVTEMPPRFKTGAGGA